MGRVVGLAWAVWLTAACSAGGGGDPSLPDGGSSFDARLPDSGTPACRSHADCADRIACSIDRCVDGACTHEPCPGGPDDCCEGELVCDVSLGCIDAPEPCATDEECLDDVRCTVDACDDSICTHAPQDGLCRDGEICLAAVGCIPPPPTSCTTPADCEVDSHCVGEWDCVTEFGCVFVSVRDCADDDPCTVDACVEERGGCVHDVPAEVCGDGIDQNCDGMIDEGCCEVGPCTTACGSAGTVECPSGTCVPPAETCNGIDDDCDARLDEGGECLPGDSSTCTTSCGSPGTRRCGTTCTWEACVPPAESCNGGDDDCDGARDEDFDCVASATTSCSTSCGSTGTSACSETCTEGACIPPAETCNGSDDDCDGTRDEGFACVASSTGSCTTACGSTGSTSCSATCMPGACVPPAETCNGSDDDCDGTRDEGFTCVAGATGSCPTACGSTGSRVCTGGCTWDLCAPPPETCNGVDDDCDGGRDELSPCIAGTSSSCTTTCGSTGSSTCSASCAVGACVPPAETCNGSDDDCDGTSDEGFPCRVGASSPCTTSCGSTGTRACLAGCVLDATCVPPAEVCNGADDDCDGTCDEPGACCRGRTVACNTLGMGFSTGTATCRSDCGGYDTSACMAAPWTPTGTWVVAPGVNYYCAFGLVSFSFGTLTFTDTGSALTVSGGGLNCMMTGASARMSRMFDVSCTLPGGCTETYRLTGTFTGDNTWTGSFTAQFTGGSSCYGCTTMTWSGLTGSR